MQKIFINPIAKEILIKGNVKEGPVDLFSYEAPPAGGGNGRALGNLFLVGNIQGGETEASDDIDVGYVLNLVASLAKREYYANADLAPKDAFTGTLKKINGVVEEFFKKKDTKINIGIFAIAGDQIHISKLGKFKIFLARAGKNIDILNNIQLFNKERTEEREFSNIISGKIIEGDRLFAFYPSRAVIAREKYIKDHFVGSSQKEFVAQLASIKEGKPDFSCVALHINVEKGTEIATAPHIQPRELQKEKMILEEKLIEPVLPAEELQPVAQAVAHLAPEPPLPKIIPSEFARAKRELPFAKHFRRYKNMSITPRVKMMTMGGIVLVALLTIFGLKSFVFVSASARQLNALISEAQNNIRLAQTKQDQKDFIGARNLLVGSLATLSQQGSSKKADGAKAQIQKALDDLDQAVEAKLNFVADIPAESGMARLIAATSSNLYIYIENKNSNSLVKINNGSLGAVVQIKEISPQSIFASDAYIALVDPVAKKITSVSTAKSTVSASTFSTDPLLSYEIYKDNLYGLTATGIIKITDAALGRTAVQPWLTSNTPLSPNTALLAVDGNIYVFSTDGVLTTYYKGKKTKENKTDVAPETGSLLLTTTDSPNLYLVNLSSNRIYIISKDSGTISKTWKINSAKPISSAALGADGTIYILSDNKIWKVQ